ncbi:hypothetical protein [Nocardioides szechwanensis]|uniref:hypothetical protein n=1 Tax=Nocardioides szechwanensis TaxID=1005944 RepID=UPI0015811CE2|nr:hypothetical protein [Nocardioides szechwanensis]
MTRSGLVGYCPQEPLVYPRLTYAPRLFGGTGGGPALQTVTAGWAAAFLTAVAMYFQISASRTTDRRLTLAGLGRVRLASARLAAGFPRP